MLLRYCCRANRIHCYLLRYITNQSFFCVLWWFVLLIIFVASVLVVLLLAYSIFFTCYTICICICFCCIYNIYICNIYSIYITIDKILKLFLYICKYMWFADKFISTTTIGYTFYMIKI